VCGINSIDEEEVDEEEQSNKIASFKLFPVDVQEQLLCVGAAISREIRKAIFDRLGFTCSTGIGPNKLVAKLASPLNKPDGQAVSIILSYVMFFSKREITLIFSIDLCSTFSGTIHERFSHSKNKRTWRKTWKTTDSFLPFKE
jgi:hypothetical protein